MCLKSTKSKKKCHKRQNTMNSVGVLGDLNVNVWDLNMNKNVGRFDCRLWIPVISLSSLPSAHSGCQSRSIIGKYQFWWRRRGEHSRPQDLRVWQTVGSKIIGWFTILSLLRCSNGCCNYIFIKRIEIFSLKNKTLVRGFRIKYSYCGAVHIKPPVTNEVLLIEQSSIGAQKTVFCELPC